MAVTLLVAYVALSASLIVIGLLLVHVLAPVRHWDDHVNTWLAAHRSTAWTQAGKDGTFVADTLGVVVVAAVATLIAIASRCGRASAVLLCGLAVELSVFLTVNYTVRRPRPVAPHVGSTPSTYSFPSGHVAATLVLYCGIALLVGSRTRAVWARALAWAVAACIVVWVGFSRVYEAEHHPTDVMAGVLLGAGALAAAAIAVQLWRPAPWQRRDEERAARGDVLVHPAARGPGREELAG